MKFDFSDLKRRMTLRHSSPKATQVEEEVAAVEVVEEARAVETTVNNKQQRRISSATIATSWVMSRQIATRRRGKTDKASKALNAIIVTNSAMCRLIVTRRNVRKSKPTLQRRKATKKTPKPGFS
jgi:hypothetical protein